MVPSPIRIAPTFKKPKDLEGSFHASDDDLDIFNLLGDEEEEQILSATAAPVPGNLTRQFSAPPMTRGVSATSSFSSGGSVCSSRSHKKPQRRTSTMSTVSTSSNSSGSGHSRKAPRRTKSSSGRSQRCASISLLEQQMANVSV